MCSGLILIALWAYPQGLFNKLFYYGHPGNLEPVTGPSGYLICSTVRFDLGYIDGFQFTRFDSTGSVIQTSGFSTGPIVNVMQYGALSLVRTDGSFSFLFGSHPYNGPYKTSLRLFNTSQLGGMNWNRKIDYTNPEYSIYYTGAMDQTFEETPDGGYLITALREYPSGSWTDTIAPMIVKLDSTGGILWNKTYDLGEICGWHITSHVDTAGVTLFGFHADTPYAIVSDNCILTKIAENGNTMWSKRVEGFEGRFTGCTMVDGRYVVSAMDSTSISVLVFDPAGTPVWGKRYTLTSQLPYWAADIRPTLDHGFVLSAGLTDGNNSSDVFFFKVDSIGTVQWERTYGNSNFEAPIDLVENSDSTFTLLAWTNLVQNSAAYYHLSRFNNMGLNDCIAPAGISLTESTIPFSLVDVVLNEFESPMISQPLYVGDSLSTGPNLLELCLNEVGVDDPVREDSLFVSPNPTSGTVTVRITGHLQGGIFNIFDMLGRQVKATMLRSRETTIDLGALPDGVYLYQAVAPAGRTIVGRLVKE